MLADRRAHTTLPTPDVDTLRKFYEQVLGLEPYAVRTGATFYRVGDGTLFAITRSGGKATGAHTQLSFTVPDVAAEVAELRARGVSFEEYETPKTVGGPDS